ncbi:MAG: hypothetical protein QHJ82_17600, partial [Verrucomicrobiota bacterium]|nr:hypothetical protein [Verrucomicrobiota bacterium]
MTMIRKISAAVIAGMVLGLAHRQGHGQGVVIESLGSNGELVCSGLKPGSRATVEWAPTVN